MLIFTFRCIFNCVLCFLFCYFVIILTHFNINKCTICCVYETNALSLLYRNKGNKYKQLKNTIMKATFAISGLEPEARNIFAFEGMTSKQKESFTSENTVYVCRNSEGMFFSKNLQDAFQFEDEDKAENVVAMLLNSNNMSECQWGSILLVDGVEATEEQCFMYANNQL